MPVPRSVAIYARISKDASGERMGVDRQLEDCRALAHELGWTVGDEYVDNDVSAHSGKVRPEYRRMLEDLRSGARDAVLAWHSDRISRGKGLEEFIDVCSAANAEVRTVRSGTLDLNTAQGRMVARIHGAIARGESERMSERMQRGNRQRAEQGRPRTNGTRSYGYERDGLTIREDEAAVIRALVERFLAGESLASLVRWLNDAEIPTVSGGGRWFSGATRAMLRRGRLSGQREYHGEIVAAGQWPAIITAEQTAAVRRILDNPARKSVRTPSRYLLTGVIRCGRCGRPMISHPRRGSPGYACRSDGGLGGCGGTSIVAEPLEELVRDLVLTALDGPDLSSAMLARQVGDVDADKLADAIRTDEAQETDVAAAFADGEMSRAQFGVANQRITKRLAANRDRLAALGGRREMARYVGRGVELRDEWESMNLNQRRAVVRAVVEAVEIGPGTAGGRAFDAGRAQVRWKV